MVEQQQTLHLGCGSAGILELEIFKAPGTLPGLSIKELATIAHHDISGSKYLSTLYLREPVSKLGTSTHTSHLKNFCTYTWTLRSVMQRSSQNHEHFKITREIDRRNSKSTLHRFSALPPRGFYPRLSSQKPHEIVIVGGNFGGVDVAHYLLRNTLPALKEAHAKFTYHITLVTPNTHYFFKVASPRAIVNQTQAPHDKIFKSLAAAFERYEPGVFTLVQGKATAVEESDRSVVVQTGDATKNIKYDSLIIASGTTSTSPIWTLHDDHKKSEAAITALHASLATATTVLIAGAGAVGIETAGEIAVAHPTTKITLLAPGTSLLPSLPPTMGTKAQKALEQLGVNIRPNARFETETNGVAKLSDGSTETPDVFIDATGPRIINTSWLPDTWLDGKSHVAMRDAYFRVSNAANVYMIGDVASGSLKTAVELNAMTPTVASSVAVDIAKSLGISAPQPGSLSAWNPFVAALPLGQKEYKPMKDTIVIPVGPGGGVGQLMGWAMPSFAIKKMKAENFMMESIEPSMNGEKWKGK